MEEELAVECAANAAYEDYRANGRPKNGRRLGAPPKPLHASRDAAGQDQPDRPGLAQRQDKGGYLQGYNAQAAVTSNQIVIAAEIFVSSPDFGLLGPVLDATLSELAAAGITDTPDVLVAVAGYWHHVQMQQIVNDGIQVLIPPDAGNRQSARPGWDGRRYAFMRRVLDTQLGGDLYRKRKGMIEPVFGNTKFNRGSDRFQRRRRSTVRSEWRLITATHNLLKPQLASWASRRPDGRQAAPRGLISRHARRLRPGSQSGSTASPGSRRPSPPIQARPRHGRLCATATSRSGTLPDRTTRCRTGRRRALVPEPGLWHTVRVGDRDRGDGDGTCARKIAVDLSLSL